MIAVDTSPSQRTGERRARARAALESLQESLTAYPDLEVRTIEVPGAGPDGSEGTPLTAAVERAAAEIPSGRFAGAVMITDGQVHDAPETRDDVALPGTGARAADRPSRRDRPPDRRRDRAGIRHRRHGDHRHLPHRGSSGDRERPGAGHPAPRRRNPERGDGAGRPRPPDHLHPGARRPDGRRTGGRTAGGRAVAAQQPGGRRCQRGARPAAGAAGFGPAASRRADLAQTC